MIQQAVLDRAAVDSGEWSGWRKIVGRGQCSVKRMNGDNRGEEQDGEGHSPPQERKAGLDGGDEGGVGGDVAVGHAGGVEGEAGMAVAVEEDEAAGGVGALGEKMDGFARGE